MRRLLILIVLLSNTLLSFAQNGLRGRVVEADGTPVIYAAVMLESGNKMVAGGMTGEDGSFLLSGQFSGKYLLKISSMLLRRSCISTLALSKYLFASITRPPMGFPLQMSACTWAKRVS